MYVQVVCAVISLLVNEYGGEGGGVGLGACPGSASYRTILHPDFQYIFSASKSYRNHHSVVCAGL